ncbi:MAG: hypothetical protein MI976_15305 [Pseudomonadales bacterium]|nr:hypothetical protein [Pseudomonadales bacterium]
MKKVKAIAAAGLFGAALISASAYAVPPTNFNGLIGTWVNTNPNDKGIIKVVVAPTWWGGISFKSYGSCSPTPCVHTTVSAQAFSASISSNTAVGFTAYRNSGFKTARFSGQRYGSYLRLDSFNTFASGDSRKNYSATDYFKKL